MLHIQCLSKKGAQCTQSLVINFVKCLSIFKFFNCFFSGFLKGFLDLDVHNAEHRHMTHHKYKDSKLVAAALATVHWHSSIIFVFVAGVS